jgi:hypothetical protein
MLHGRGEMTNIMSTLSPVLISIFTYIKCTLTSLALQTGTRPIELVLFRFHSHEISPI